MRLRSLSNSKFSFRAMLLSYIETASAGIIAHRVKRSPQE